MIYFSKSKFSSGFIIYGKFESVSVENMRIFKSYSKTKTMKIILLVSGHQSFSNFLSKKIVLSAKTNLKICKILNSYCKINVFNKKCVKIKSARNIVNCKFSKNPWSSKFKYTRIFANF